MINVFIFTILWIFNLLNGTGLGNAYYTTEILMATCFVLGILKISYKISRSRTLSYGRNIIFEFFCFITIAITSSFLHNKLDSTLQFLWIYFLVYLISDLRVKDNHLKLICNTYGVLGVCLLYLYNYTQLLSGWNANTISMIALYSYLFFLLPYYGKRNFIKKTFVLLVSLFYFIILIGTNSRAAMIFSIIAILLVIFNTKDKIIKKSNINYFLLIPLFIVFFVIFISNTDLLEPLNEWSLKEMNKPIFNGRDELWINGLKVLSKNPLFGSGDLTKANWHNSSIVLLTSYGVIGYITWILSLKYILKKALNQKYEKLLAGVITMFFILYVHQSVELGFISTRPILLPYIMLGVILSRTKCLERLHKNEKRKIN